MKNEVTQYYIEGVREGRHLLKTYGTEGVTIADRIANLNSTIKGFSASSPVGQMLRGELDFWINQNKKVSV